VYREQANDGFVLCKIPETLDCGAFLCTSQLKNFSAFVGEESEAAPFRVVHHHVGFALPFPPAEEQRARELEWQSKPAEGALGNIVCVSSDPNDIPRLLDYSV
jgi:hypothetical protein